MRAVPRQILAAAVIMCLPGAGLAHVGTASSPAFELPSGVAIDVHDGNLSDWEEIVGPISPSLTKEQARPLFTGSDFAVDSRDLDFSWFFAWSANPPRLYFAAQVYDDFYSRPDGFADDEVAFDYDSLELMVDGDHSGGPFGYLRSAPGGEGSVVDSSTVGVQAQHYMLFPGSPTRARMRGWPMDSPWLSRPPYGDVGGAVQGLTGSAGTQYLVEGYVTPWDSLDTLDPVASRASILRDGSIIGLQIAVSDCDLESRPCHGYFTLYGAANTWRMAQNFVDLELVGTNDETASEPNSWGRVKASIASW